MSTNQNVSLQFYMCVSSNKLL